ncbi:hypothetical protein M0638_12645 [Roseomonas sp. NAR14]|uniref:Uncharacterized protein n=1 Tax=Roseomonas acroporae TaxID=2937791 RepID=A0A9X2BWS0_9PROT|nr:hypothetical protein [Roseomonas acroporae]MCK8785234.1 hypothetical protein [Roseomonas acroporae]
MSDAVPDQPHKFTLQELFIRLSTAQGMVMAAMVRALRSDDPAAVAAVAARLQNWQPVHEDPMTQEMATKMHRMMVLTLTASEEPAGRA